MSDLKFSQEMKNMILDLRDDVNRQSQIINQMGKVSKSQQDKIVELETEIKKLKAAKIDFNSFFGGNK